ncbi:MAG: phytochelatin synthase family protein [Bdellovibrionia bacterium]
MKSLSLMAFALILSVHTASPANAAESKPKYGPMANVLSQSHDYFKSAPAPDFWALIPYYAAQMDESACSVASVTMITNGARVGKKLTADDELVTQQAIAEKVLHKAWHKGMMKKAMGYSTNLDELGEIAREAFEKYGIHVKSVEVVHADAIDEKTKAKLHEALVENEKSAHDFILLNFNQKVFTGDAEVGHISPIGAYDEKNHKVLVMDPDRKWYEPYWVSEETLLMGMATKDSSTQRNRGFVWIKF